MPVALVTIIGSGIIAGNFYARQGAFDVLFIELCDFQQRETNQLQRVIITGYP
jgi:hypothetical protein